jgi:hypothetical protein
MHKRGVDGVPGHHSDANPRERHPDAGTGERHHAGRRRRRVVAGEPRFAGIRPLDPELIGQSSWYTVEPSLGAPAYVVTFRVGSGDCPSGCIDEHTWVYGVARDGTATLASEIGNPTSPDASPR